MRHALYLPPFGELADPGVLGELAVQAEEAGFEGVFLWDHVVRPKHAGLEVCDPWIALAAIAERTERVTIGTRITPLSRRRPHDVARQAIALDRLSGGRFVLGVGLGGDNGGELSKLGEETDARTRAEMLDESLELLGQLWSGETVTHDGPHYRVDGLRFVSGPVRIPIWVAAQSVKPGPLRRAARFDGLCPETTPDGLRAMLAEIERQRGCLEHYEVAVGGRPGDDPEPFREAGATWWLVTLPEITTVKEAMDAINRSGPPSPGQ
ncbi:LLM class flavin-dependent oxidoreductase [Actinomadura barringtoniae]|uniref:LLM class flavin-dependent oxidoreductase n=1 Tax=Actinomadura barringtoniae TaxID=1427535 RepID=A0A939T4D9_9ACTN|nr:LLM class flavin-dependent oxidoreductase [Actinomadura barringtoniae]MBO2448059.1 LLM class flavin-dependent oxidoreductase [Actinomadura barringtoniae]